jgi:Regulator of ribonuclease activity B
MRTCSRGQRACIPNALPVRRWQAKQWQIEILTGPPSSWTVSWPHEQASESPDPAAEKIHYFVFADKDAASAAEQRLRKLGQVSVDTNESDAGDAYCLIAVSTSAAASPTRAELEQLAREVKGTYDGSETELR